MRSFKEWIEFGISIVCETLAVFILAALVIFGVFQFLSYVTGAETQAQQQNQIKRDYRRVVVGVYYMPGSSPESPTQSTLGRRRRAGPVCPACDLFKRDEQRLMEERPDVWFGISADGWNPTKTITFNGEHRHYGRSKTGIDTWPTIIVFSGTPGSWGQERFRMTGYAPEDYEKVVQMIDWAAEY